MTTQMPVEDVADLPALERWRRAAGARAHLIAEPDNTEEVLAFSNLINAGRRDDRLHFFYDDPRGQRLYDEKRAIDSTSVDLAKFLQLPEGTLGRAYATFMTSHGLTPNVFDGPPEDVRNEQASFVIQRMRQTHDLWHVVTNCETDPAGEVALQAFTFAQVRAPSSAFLAMAGMLRTVRKNRQIVRDVVRLYRAGAAAEKLVVFPWEDHWATPLTEVRRLLKLPENPGKTGGYMTSAWTERTQMAA